MEKRTKGKHGWFNYYSNDTCIGRSLEYYGEYCELEIDLIKQFINEDSVVLDVGANIGTHSVPLSKYAGTVHAFEACFENYAMLCRNSPRSCNYHCAVSNYSGQAKVKNLDLTTEGNYGKVTTSRFENGNVSAISIDSLELPRVNFIKVDVEGNEPNVLQGAYTTVRRDKPHILIEAQDENTYVPLYRMLKEQMNYYLYWFPVATYNPNNYKKNQINIFGKQHGVLNWVATTRMLDGLEPVSGENDTIEQAQVRQFNRK